MTKLVSIEEIQSVATYNCDQSNKGNKYPDDIIRGGHPAAQNQKKKDTGEQSLNLFSTSIAAFKGVSWQNVKSKLIFDAARCLYITLKNSSTTCTVIH